MQQTITINILDPALPATPDVDAVLPQTSDMVNLLAEHALLFAIIGIAFVVTTIALFSRKILRGGGQSLAAAFRAVAKFHPVATLSYCH